MFVSDRTSHLKINSKYFERRAQCDRRRHCRSVHLSPFSFSSPYSFFDSIFETKAINDSSAYSARTYYGEPIHGNMLETQCAMKINRKKKSV